MTDNDKSIKKIALFAAMKSEIPKRLDRYTSTSSTFRINTYVCGIGIPKATMALEEVIYNDKPDMIIMLGFCGAVNACLNVGDLVIGRTFRNGDRTITMSEDAFHLFDVSEYVKNKQSLIGILETKVDGVLSRKDIHTSTHAVDMESYCVADVANKYKIPYLIMKSISDIVPVQEPVLLPRSRLILRMMRNFFIAKKTINDIYSWMFTSEQGNKFVNQLMVDK
jgi:nucleoside phosphorylase